MEAGSAAEMFADYCKALPKVLRSAGIPHHIVDECRDAWVRAGGDPRAVTLVLKFVAMHVDNAGNTRPMPRSLASLFPSTLPVVGSFRCALRFAKPQMTFRELLDNVLTGYDTTQLMFADPDHGIELALRRALSGLMYLCCTNADLEVRQPKSGKRRQRTARSDSPEIKVVTAGVNVGTQLRRWRVEYSASRSGGSDGSMAGRKPHQRRSHFQRFRYGPRRSLRTGWRFMPMQWVNLGTSNLKPTAIRQARPD
jgi:hypothetical protein